MLNMPGGLKRFGLITCFNYFFIPPFFTFEIDALQGWTAVLLFLVTALSPIRSLAAPGLTASRPSNAPRKRPPSTTWRPPYSPA